MLMNLNCKTTEAVENYNMSEFNVNDILKSWIQGRSTFIMNIVNIRHNSFTSI